MGQSISSSPTTNSSGPQNNVTNSQLHTGAAAASQDTAVNNMSLNAISNYSTDLSTPQPNQIDHTTTTTTNGTISSNNDGDQFSLEVFGTVLYPLRWITLATLTSWLGPLSSLAMIVGCALPFVPQYATIYKTRSCSGFSTYVCLTLLIANILRIAFWFGSKFELPLLIQSIVMILVQVPLLELCVRIKRQQTPLIRRSIFSSSPRFFWRWLDLASYLVFLFLITALLSILVYYFIDNRPFIEMLGLCGLITESMLGLPQVIRNYRKRSVVGMSLSMVLMWLAGDTFKTGYFIARAAPYQFWLCGSIQIAIDIVILLQVCLFKHSAPIKKRPSNTDSAREMVAL